MKISHRLLNLMSLDKTTPITKILLSLLTIGFVFFISESNVFGQVVNFFVCSPTTLPNYCRHMISGGTARARADFRCSNWTTPQTELAFVRATSDFTCSNGVTVENAAQVSDRDTYVDSFIEADTFYGPLARTVTSFAMFCNRTTTPLLYQTYPEACNRPRSGSGGCYSGFTTSGKRFSENASPESCSPCNPTQYELDECWQSGGNYDWSFCYCGHSPILIDVSGNGFNLTNAANGVSFDLNADDTAEQISWTSADSDDAWLALDRNGNGMIDDSKELFGNNTPQPTPSKGNTKNGFLALAEYDTAANGGNEDGAITAQDAVFGNLRLWQDANHNGISEAGELKTLSSLGLAKIELDYKEAKKIDEYGNKFKYRAKVKDEKGAQIGRWAWDVYLMVETSNSQNLSDKSRFKIY